MSDEHKTVEAQSDKKDMVEAIVTVTFASACVFVIKACAQAIAGYLGLTLFKKTVAWYKARRKKNDHGCNPEIPEDSATAASQSALPRRRNGRRILRRKG